MPHALNRGKKQDLKFQTYEPFTVITHRTLAMLSRRFQEIETAQAWSSCEVLFGFTLQARQKTG